ncbi:MAG TPA: bifunctional phosphoglucose/phosphomannose isomerase [Solirubrobacteraceae bacterium]|jgi:glucose/mannose-6-phosphate isomerase
MAGGLGREEIAQVDRSGLLADVLAIPDHLRDALWRVESAGGLMEEWDSPGGLIVAGMGESAIGGALARAALGDHESRHIAVARGYGLPPWATPDTTVLLASYTGDTEETLACYDAAGFVGARRVVVTSGGPLADQAREDGVPVIPVPGGFQARSAIAYMTVATLEVAAQCGCGPRMASEIDVAASHAEALAREWGPEGPDDALPKEIARGIHGSVPVIAGAGITSPIAYRWKTQINENAKSPAFSHELPELDHNEIVGWDGVGDLGPFSLILLDDADLHPRVRHRIELTQWLVETNVQQTYRVETQGRNAVERVFSLVLLGDLVSVYLAVLRGIDPAPVAVIERLKAQLAER